MRLPLQVDTDITRDNPGVTVTRIVDADGDEVAEITWSPDSPSAPTPEQVARLLAAAPGLRDACEDLVEWNDSGLIDATHRDERGNLARSVVAARAAIRRSR